MAELENLKLDLVEGILTITISRVESLNALNIKTIEELREAVQNAYEDKEVKGIIITGAGSKAFVAGADIKEIAELNEVNARKFAENGQEAFALIEDSEKPVIAAVNGFALGGGCELAMACHIRIASDNAKFGLPEVSLGIIPGYGGTQRLPRLVGKGKALELIMTGDMISAADATACGLVNKVVPQDELLESSRQTMKKILSRGPLAVGMAINCVNASYHCDENGYQTEANGFSTCVHTKDFVEGTSAFIDKRKPQFRGE